METFSLRYVSRDGARKAGAEKSQGPIHLIYRPAGTLTPHRHNWNVGRLEALAQWGFRQITVLFCKAAQLTK